MCVEFLDSGYMRGVVRHHV